MLSRYTSLENKLITGLVIVMGLLSSLLLCILILLDLSSLMQVTIFSFVLPCFLIAGSSTYKLLTRPYIQLLGMLDSIKYQDHSKNIFAAKNKGIVAQIMKEMSDLNTLLRQDKYKADKNRLLVYQLVELLDTPVLLVNEKGQLINGNSALSQYLQRDWHSLRLSHISLFGFMHDGEKWKLSKSNNQIKLLTSHFDDGSQRYQLIMLNDISQQITKTQQESWQQQIRILSHEMRNSLTPIQSISETLSSIIEDTEQKLMLDVISNRSQNLNTLVLRYSELTRIPTPYIQQHSLKALIEKLEPLFSDIEFHSQFDAEYAQFDDVLMEQVVINLLTNTQQACESNPKIKITSVRHSNKVCITFEDNGRGLVNEKDVFVPFYTTKPDGQGIGLNLCLQIINLHQGGISLRNRSEGSGAIVTITLPIV
jgi:two-component system, NtrC family, nitrogen regulation sensor histidine kinase NtrY